MRLGRIGARCVLADLRKPCWLVIASSLAGEARSNLLVAIALWLLAAIAACSFLLGVRKLRACWNLPLPSSCSTLATASVCVRLWLRTIPSTMRVGNARLVRLPRARET